MPGAHSRRAKAAAARHMATGSAPRAAVKNRRKEYRGVAQLVARHIWDVDAASSSLAAPTIAEERRQKSTVFCYIFVYAGLEEYS